MPAEPLSMQSLNAALSEAAAAPADHDRAADQRVAEQLEAKRVEWERQCTQQPLAKEYVHPLAGVVLNANWKDENISNVLCIFLGPPQTLTRRVTLTANWNPFHTQGNPAKPLVPSLKLLEEKFLSVTIPGAKLSDYVLMDCLPHRAWSSKIKITDADLAFAACVIRDALQILQPRIVLCFGKHPVYILRQMHQRQEIDLQGQLSAKAAMAKSGHYAPARSTLNFAGRVGWPFQAVLLPHPGTVRGEEGVKKWRLHYDEGFGVLLRHVELVADEEVSEDEEEEEESDRE